MLAGSEKGVGQAVWGLRHDEGMCAFGGSPIGISVETLVMIA